MYEHNTNEENVLTERETQVLECIKQGLSNAQISRKLYISVSTVKAHITTIFEKYKVKNRVDLLIKIMKNYSR